MDLRVRDRRVARRATETLQMQNRNQIRVTVKSRVIIYR